ncbi:unnamed protein product [Phytophthora fragariaefolia]|uniref:Unnamed protein product n=1 Tax=Phytophthora fragariaefolia TaxID=1490495 RepID=A0A9W7D0M6_9STRA|nr:unnamed protein product [Phytophthora fragariaefolia]
MFYTPSHLKRDGLKRKPELQVITQHLQGFIRKRREAWLRGWKQRTETAPADIIFVQDTHLKTKKDTVEMSEMWNRVCGAKQPAHPLSYWTTTASNSGGVGILLLPHVAARIRPWKQNDWTDRRIAVEFDNWCLTNIYAPANRCKRQEFFSDLSDWMDPTISTLLGGDFNAVLNPRVDRIVDGMPNLGACESKELNHLIENLDLMDARSASRIDRFYVTSDISGTAQWVEAREPVSHSDHQELRLWLTIKKSHSRKRKGITRYPISSPRPEWVQTQIQKRIKKLTKEFQSQSCPAAAWDTFAKQLSVMINVVARMDREHTEHYYDRLQTNTRSLTSTRTEILLKAQHHRTHLQDTSIQRIRLQQKEWHQNGTILGASHAKVSSSDIRDALKNFHEVPEQNRLQPDEQKKLTRLIEEQEVLTAIEQLPRDKSGGSSGLSHDVFKDFKAELVGSLTAVYQAILNGAAVPKSFLDAVVVPLRKKGD